MNASLRRSVFFAIGALGVGVACDPTEPATIDCNDSDDCEPGELCVVVDGDNVCQASEGEGEEGEGEVGEGEGEPGVAFVDAPPALLPVGVDVDVSWQASGGAVGCEARSNDASLVEVVAVDATHATLRGVGVGAANVALACTNVAGPSAALAVWTSSATLTSPAQDFAGSEVSADVVVTGTDDATCALRLHEPLQDLIGGSTAMVDGVTAGLVVRNDGTADVAVVCEAGGLSRAVELGVVAATPVVFLDSLHIGEGGSVELGYRTVGASRCSVPSVVDAVATLDGVVVPAQPNGVRGLTIACENDDEPALVGTVSNITINFGSVNVTTDAEINDLRNVGVVLITGTLRIEGPAITSLAPFSGLLEVGALEIVGTGSSITSLAGLEVLGRVVGRFAMIETEALTSLSGGGAGLINLTDVGELSVGSSQFPNQALTSAALPSLARVGQVFIESNPALATVSLPAIETAPQIVVSDQPALTGIDFGGLTAVDGSFVVVSCGAAAAPLTIAAPQLQSVGALTIASNAGLRDLSLPSLRTASSVAINGNSGDLGCDEIAAVVCALDPVPSSTDLNLQDSSGVCFGGAAPTCP